MFSLKKSSGIALLCAGLVVLATTVLLAWARSSLNSRGLASSSRMSSFPRVFLWTWERPEDLEFLDPREVGIAFLAETIQLRGDEVIERPRLQPLKVPTGATIIAVVRLEIGRDAKASLSKGQRAATAEALARIAHKPGIAALQIDFDATQSQRDFYRALIEDVRRTMPESMPLSITALASWCVYDNWLSDLPIDEAVPMVFQMGLDRQQITSYLQTGESFRAPICRASIGVSTDEFAVKVSKANRVYVFNPRPWTASDVRDVLERSYQ